MMLPAATAGLLKQARRINDPTAKLAALAQLDLPALDIPLLRDARRRFAAGLPDHHAAMTSLAGSPVYEARDSSGAGWGGAIVNPEWDPSTAADELGEVVVRFCLHAVDQKHRDELLRTCVPFLQPDKTMSEAIYRKDLRVQVLLTRAGLMQLLATERPIEPVNNSCPPEPQVLHYTAKKSLVQAYVDGLAVRAVCGQWWVPVGDDTTHSSLPICPDCESGAPFAQAVRDILARSRRP